jgi:hypothetical protein
MRKEPNRNADIKGTKCPSDSPPKPTTKGTATTPKTLTDSERQRLRECVILIRKNQQLPFESGAALSEIRAKELYREEGLTFEEYCEKNLDITRVHAKRLIKAHECIQNLKATEPIGSVTLPTTESQARAVADLDKDDQIKVARKVKQSIGDRSATAKDFAQAREELFPKKKTEATNGIDAAPGKTTSAIYGLTEANGDVLIKVSEAVEYARDILKKGNPVPDVQKELEEALKLLQGLLIQIYPPEEAP